MEMTIILRTIVCASLLATSCGGGGGGGIFGDDDAPYADMFNSLGHQDHLPVRGRLVLEEEDVDITRTTPFSQLSQRLIQPASNSVRHYISQPYMAQYGPTYISKHTYIHTHALAAIGHVRQLLR